MTPSKEKFIDAIAGAVCGTAPCSVKQCTSCRNAAVRVFAVIARFATAEPAAPGKATAGK